ncbi:MAG: hypothetical protein ACRC3Y_16775, partial [Romboutsia sp.]|uniref:hypothetical protein n=1 Tax=Romboutsia sp. TaxID=1965302 RepID=UPI003F32F357
MVKYLIKRKMKKEAQQKGKKTLIYTGAVLTGVGAYFSYRALKNYKIKRELEEEQYLEDSEYEIYNYDNEMDRTEDDYDDELEEKVNEFNSRRINHDTCPHVSKEELESYVKESEEYKEEEKEEIILDKNKYKEDKYDKYEYYEDDLSKD